MIKDFEIIVTPPIAPPIAMTVDAMLAYEALGVDRLVVNLGSQRAERIAPRMEDIAALVQQPA